MSVTNICNLALSQVPAGAITSIDEQNLVGRTCKLWYPQVLAVLMAKGSWQFATRRAALATIDSDRLGEWLYAFTPPVSMAFPLQVNDANGSGPLPHEFTGSVIYSNFPDVLLDYITGADQEATADGLFRDAFIALLAARLVVPITKNFRREAELIKASEVAIDRAVAFNANLNPATYMNHVPDVVLARQGILPEQNLGQLPGPEATYPDFDPVGTFESELG